MFKGTVSLVTGAASGFGKATAEKFVQHGGKVVLLDIQGGRLQHVAETLGDNAIPCVGDITSDEDVRKAVELVKTNFGKLDHVVNCAGWTQAYQIYNFNKNRQCLTDFFTKCLRVNAFGTLNVIRLTCGLLAKNEANGDGHRGVIVNTACSVALEADAGQVAIAASHGAVVGMTRPLSWDLAPQGLRVVTIAPGLFESRLHGDLPRLVRDHLEKMVPFPSRMGKVKEYAGLVAAVITNPGINGCVIKLDAAFRMFPMMQLTGETLLELKLAGKTGQDAEMQAQ